MRLGAAIPRLIAPASLILAASLAACFSSATAQGQPLEKVDPEEIGDIDPNSFPDTYRIYAGGGNASFSVTQFLPAIAEIAVGDRIMWVNPAKVPEPHTVTFTPDNRSKATLEAAVAIPKSTGMPAEHYTAGANHSNAEPLVIRHENATDLLLAFNARAFNAVAIGPAGNVTYLEEGSPEYLMAGDEMYVNSGVLLPATFADKKAAIAFMVTFEKAGTYDYACMFHPWMNGTVIVSKVS